MLTARTKKELADAADSMARGFMIVEYKNVLYLPVDYETLEPQPADAARTAWVPLPPKDLVELANSAQQVLFTNDSEMRSYVSMVRQTAILNIRTPTSVLLNTASGLRELTSDGQLHEPSTQFVPNYIRTKLVETPEHKALMLATLTEWLGGSTEDAESLLSHLATVLAPHWSAVRYVLLIGYGRNGKSLIMKMLVDLLGQHNVSHVTRQDMSVKSPVCHDLTNRMLNVVFDGGATYLKDSGLEKTLTAGEIGSVKKLYDTYPTNIQTNGLFIEGLNKEPKSSDKSTALQKRIVRFNLPNTYELDLEFEKRMRSDEMLGALLALMVERYVKREEVAKRLALTSRSRELKLEQMHVNDHAIQFFEYIEDTDPLGVAGFIDEDVPVIIQKFNSWRLRECNDISPWAAPDVKQLLKPLLNTTRKSRRVAGKVKKVDVVTGLRTDLVEYLDYIREDVTTDARTMVEDGAVHDLESDTLA